MTSNADYPRMLFHRSLAPVTVHSEAEEKALGPEWSRTIPAEEPPEVQPPAEPEEPDEQEDPEEEKPEERQPVQPPLRKPVKPAATRQWRH
jgi:hypothetical protein